jgi:tetratricopeptide (TPR) repeat protein
MPFRPYILPLLLLLPAWLAAQDEAALIAKGDSLLAADRPAKAMEQFNAAVALKPDADALAARARGWYVQGKYDKFLKDCAAALDIDSLHPQANYQRALHAFRTNDNDGAVRFCTRALVRGAKPALQQQVLILRGQAGAASGHKRQAITDLVEGIGDRTDEVPAMKLLARLYNETGDPASSLAVLEKLCVLQPKDIGNWSNKGFELNQLERYTDALDAFDKALELDKDEPVVLSNKAYALLKLGRDEEAMTTVNRSLRSDATNAYALRTRALLYLRKGEGEKACNDLSLSKAMGNVPEVDALLKQHCAGVPARR